MLITRALTVDTLLPAIVLRALDTGVVDVGQLSRTETAALTRWTRRGVLLKTTAWWYPIPKTMYIGAL